MSLGGSSGSVKTKKSCVSCKIFEMEFKFSKLVKMCLGVSEPTKQLAAQSTAYALGNRQGKQAFIKKKKKIKKKQPNNDFSVLESCQLYITAKYKAGNCCKIEAGIQTCSAKKVFLKRCPSLFFNKVAA